MLHVSVYVRLCVFSLKLAVCIGVFMGRLRVQTSPNELFTVKKSKPVVKCDQSQCNSRNSPISSYYSSGCVRYCLCKLAATACTCALTDSKFIMLKMSIVGSIGPSLYNCVVSQIFRSVAKIDHTKCSSH